MKQKRQHMKVHQNFSDEQEQACDGWINTEDISLGASLLLSPLSQILHFTDSTDNWIITAYISCQSVFVRTFRAISVVSQVADGFIAHFYAVCEQISPVLAWGFLGPKSSLHDFCCFFKVSLSIGKYCDICQNALLTGFLLLLMSQLMFLPKQAPCFILLRLALYLRRTHRFQVL